MSRRYKSYRHTGHEMQAMHGLNWIDNGARMRTVYDGGSFTTVDPMAEKRPWESPYCYAGGNPMNALDPDGRWVQFLVPLVKGAIGAVVDVGAQMTVSMSNGQGFREALSNIDYTSVGASFVTSAIAAPGMSTTAKVITATAVTADALVDVSPTKGFESVSNGKKYPTNAVVDFGASVLPGKLVDAATSKFTTAVTSDLTSKSASTLAKETKATMKDAIATVKSDKFQTTANSAASYIGGVTGGKLNEALNRYGGESQSSNSKSLTQPVDATLVKRPEVFINLNIKN